MDLEQDYFDDGVSLIDDELYSDSDKDCGGGEGV
ncbi:hypothetical protein PC128_g26997 [Phytophthora cactorum]|nr:hypothetical protein PC128_g26997 [Phytophthora cactorum]KAG4036911.1 hypothetical protein PC123_g27520 [Phytophthora cactorum]